MVLLTALATEFAFSMKMEVNTTKNYKDDIESYHLAKGGIHLAMAELLRPARFHSIHPEHGWISGIPKPEEDLNNLETITTPGLNTEEETLEFLIVEREEIPLGNGTITYSISDESGKVGINTSTRDVIVKVLTESGMEIGEERDIIADSILDWIDADDNHRLNGAEKDYYRRQSPPYRAKNGKLDTLGELIKVRGMTEEILYGSKEGEIQRYKGLEKYFTVYPVTTVNPNTADREVLSALYEDDKVGEIESAIEEKGYYSEFHSTIFNIESTGMITDSGVRHTIKAVMEKQTTNEGSTLFIHYWNDNSIEP